MRTILLIVALIALGVGVFVYAMRAANLYILASEGLQLRIACILQDGPKETLPAYFTEAFLAGDSQLNASPYEDYTITNYDYRVEVESVSVFPWSNSATVTVVERMHSLNGEINEDKRPEGAAKEDRFPPPEWEGARYTLRFRLIDDRFYISQMQLMEKAPEVSLLPTPDMSKTMIPAATQTPAITATPTATATPVQSPVS